MMTRQEIFDKVWNHFVTNNQPLSFEEVPHGTDCKYRGPNDAKCAVGIFISDEEYARGVEEEVFDEMLLSAEKSLGDGLPTLNKETINLFNEYYHLFEELQSCHDDVATGRATSIKERLTNLANMLGLKIPE